MNSRILFHDKINHDKSQNEQHVYDMLESIAHVDIALANILDAEAERIRKAVEFSAKIEDLLEVNRSVQKTIANAIQLEQVHYQQLEQADGLCRLNRSKRSRSDDPVYPACPRHEPKPGKEHHPKDCCSELKPPCPNPLCSKPPSRTSVFCAATEYQWTGGTAMYLRQESYGDHDVRLCRKKCDSLILLPAGKKYRIEYEIEIVNRHAKPVSIVMKLCNRNRVLQTKNLFTCVEKYNLNDSGTFVWETPSGYAESAFGIWLQSSSNLKISKGEIFITDADFRNE